MKAAAGDSTGKFSADVPASPYASAHMDCFIASGSCGRFKPASELALESTPFDIFVKKDIRTSLQVACFYELGSTADLQQDVGKPGGTLTVSG